MSRHIAIAVAFALLAAGLPAALALLPQPGFPVAVIAYPWAERGAAVQIVTAADGMLLDAHRDGKVAIATSAAADFVARLYRSGAALVVDGAALAGCFPLADDHRPFVKRTAI
jgi:hypothetical protein